MFWRLHAQRLLVERGQKDVVPQLVALVRNQAGRRRSAPTAARSTRCGRCRGWARLATPRRRGYRAAVEALKHPAAGVRKAAAMVLPKTPEAATAIVERRPARRIPTCTRAWRRCSPSPRCRRAGGRARRLYAEAKKPENFNDRWLSRAIYIAATRHRDTFLTQYKADPAATPFTALPAALRLGDTKPDWRTPPAADLRAEWKDMQVPGAWETKRPARFRRRRLVHADDRPAAGRDADRALARARQQQRGGLGERAVGDASGRNGGRGAAAAAGGGRGGGPPVYSLPAGAMQPGRQHDHRPDPEQPERRRLPRHARVDVRRRRRARAPLAGTWRYRVERQTNAGALYAKPGELAAHVAFTAEGGLAGAAGAALPKVAAAAPDVVLRLAVVPGQMQFDTDGADRGAGSDGRDRLRQSGRHAAQLRARRAGLARRPRRRRRRRRRARRTAWRSSTCPTRRRCCSRPSCSSPARR